MDVYGHESNIDSSYDRVEPVSDASQYVADGSVVRAVSFVSLSSNSVTDGDVIASSPSKTFRSTTSFQTVDRLITQGLASCIRSPQREDYPYLSGFVEPLPSAEGHRFRCPKCPREFKDLGKAR